MRRVRGSVRRCAGEYERGGGGLVVDGEGVSGVSMGAREFISIKLNLSP